MDRRTPLWISLAIACGPPLGGEADSSTGADEADTSTTRADPPGPTSADTGSADPTTGSADVTTVPADPTDTTTTTSWPDDTTGTDVTTGSADSTTTGGHTTDPDTSTGAIETATTGSSTSSSIGSDSSSSSTGEPFATCYTESWSVTISEAPWVYAPAVDPNGLVFVAAEVNSGDDGWAAAWTLDGEPQWSQVIDPVALGLDDDSGYAVDIDVLVDGDALLSYHFSGDDHVAAFARLDADTGDVVWSTLLGSAELGSFDPEFGIYGGRASNGAVTASGRAFVHGTAYGAFGSYVFVAELDASDGAVLSLTEVDYLDMGVKTYGSGTFLADDVTGIYRGYFLSFFGPYAAYRVRRYSLEGEFQNSLGPIDAIGDGETIYFSSLALAPDGNLAMSWTWANNDKGPPSETIPFLERRSPDNTLLLGGLGDSPEVAGQLAFEADGDLVAVYSTIYKLDPDLAILSADEIDANVYGVTVLPDDDLIVGGRRDGEGFLARYASCGD